MSLRSDQEWMIEVWIFFDLCKSHRRPNVEQTYIAIQSALAYQAKKVDVGTLLAKIRPPGYRGLDDGYTPNIGVSGLAFFHWIYDVELIKEGLADYHTYRFVRKHDKKEILVTLKTECDPLSKQAIHNYKDQLEKLKKARIKLFETKRYGSLDEFLFGSQ